MIDDCVGCEHMLAASGDVGVICDGSEHFEDHAQPQMGSPARPRRRSNIPRRTIR